MMRTVQSLDTAKVFPNHRSLIAEIVALKDAGKIDGYSLHTQRGGVSAGVQVADKWEYLA